MQSSQKTFRVFVSSTFSDMRAERRILQEAVFPCLKRYCESKGATFQAVDLRWGVNEEAQLDHKTVDICLHEIERCQKLSPKPNFIVLLGDRYGWQPVPSRITSSEMREIIALLSEDKKKDIAMWYREDLNAVPPEYVLQSRGEAYKKYDDWKVIEEKIRTILRRTVDRLNFSEEQREKFFCSATHQEIIRGVLNPPKSEFEPSEHVFAYIRTINGLPEAEEAKDFIDIVDGKRDPYAKNQIEKLNNDLRRKLPKEHLHDYDAQWEKGCCIDDVEAFAERVHADLYRIIEQQLSELVETDELTRELELHKNFKDERLKHFTGREEVLNAIEEYLSPSPLDPSLSPLIKGGSGGGEGSQKVLSLIGPSGSGKTSIMAKAIDDANTRVGAGSPRPHGIVCRFAGRTSGSSNPQSLLNSLIQEICREYGTEMKSLLKEGEDEKKFSTVWGLREIFTRSLALAKPESPLIVFIDALDQLASDVNSLSPDWLPREIPENVKMVVSALPELEQKLSHTEILRLQPMPEKEAGKLLDSWLDDVNRKLEDHQRNEVISQFAANGTPLYLKLAFERARTWHSYTSYVAIDSDIDGILGGYFDELERTHGEMLVQKFCGYVLSGKYQGLTEGELLDLFVFDKEHWEHFIEHSHPDHRIEIEEIGRLPIVVWSRLFLDLEPYLTEKAATGFPIISFYHRQFIEYAEKKYLHPAEEESCSAVIPVKAGVQTSEEKIDSRLHGNDAEGGKSAEYHKILADYFEPRWPEPYERALDELPYHRTQARDIAGIERVLADLDFIEAKCRAEMTYDVASDYMHALSLKEEWHGRKRVEEFHRFFMKESHVLRQYPELTFQQAMNQPDRSEPHKAADLLWASFRRQWVKWINKPQHEDPCIMTLTGTDRGVNTCAISPDGKLIIWGAWDGILTMWDKGIGGKVATLRGHDDEVRSSAISPDGKWIVAAYGDKTLTIWDVETQVEFHTLNGHTASVEACAISPDGQRIVSASKDGTTKIWDKEAGIDLITLRGHTSFVTGCAISPDGMRIVSASWDKTLKIWNMETGVELGSLEGHENYVSGCAISPDGQRIVSASWDETLKVWNMETHAELRTLKGHKGAVLSCAISPDGKLIVSTSTDNTIKIWSMEAGTELATLIGHTLQVDACAISPDGSYFVSGSQDQTIKIWDMKAAALFASEGHTSSITSCAASADGKHSVSGSDDKTLKIWDMETGIELITLIGHTKAVTACAISPDGRRIVSASEDKTLKVWDIETGTDLITLKGHRGEVTACVICPDGRRIVSASQDNTLKVWDMETGSEFTTLKGHTAEVNDCAISPDGKWTVSASSDRTLKVWDMQTGTELTTLKGHTAQVNDCAISPDGQLIVSVSLYPQHEALKIWHASTGTELSNHTGLDRRVAINPFSDFTFLTSYSDNFVVISGPEAYAFWLPGRCETFKTSGESKIVIVDSLGMLYILELMGYESNRMPLTVLARIWISQKKTWDHAITVSCQWCGMSFVPNHNITDVIATIAESAGLGPTDSPCLKLPPEAWEDPRLLSECPHCHKPLRFNPFIVDNRDKYER